MTTILFLYAQLYHEKMRYRASLKALLCYTEYRRISLKTFSWMS